MKSKISLIFWSPSTTTQPACYSPHARAFQARPAPASSCRRHDRGDLESSRSPGPFHAPALPCAQAPSKSARPPLLCLASRRCIRPLRLTGDLLSPYLHGRSRLRLCSVFKRVHSYLKQYTRAADWLITQAHMQDSPCPHGWRVDGLGLLLLRR